ncbi:MAG TPA: saccharopine dehydrogenase NADP-binding domain-containing protein [Chitinophagales bacterium]|nr:saccharopine dehydrogenase NADP-binding domain-containing protein [Chitinophagales bacterium]
MTENSFLLYGANGYTGELIARYADQYNLQPILAGRSEAPLMTLSERLHLSYKVIDLKDTTALHAALSKVKLVVNAAGPFKFTAKEMVDACLQTGTHYIDINGDVAMFELLKGYDEKAQKAGIMILPGAGFDVVPTDCLALLLKNMLPDATSLKLAFAPLGGGLSHGTATTMATKLGEGGAVRKHGKIVRVPLGHKGMEVDFGMKKIFVMSIPWGDISTAHFTTGIPDIETYTRIKPSVYRMLKFQSLYNWLLRTSPVRNFISKKINQRPAGPTDEMRSKAISLVWGQATDQKGNKATARLRGPDGYTLTMLATLLITQKILQGNFKAGYQTPASAYGEELVLEIPGVSREILSEQ